MIDAQRSISADLLRRQGRALNDDSAGKRGFPKVPDQRRTTQTGHLIVDDQQVEKSQIGDNTIQGLLSVRSAFHDIARLVQHASERLADRLLVVDAEDAVRLSPAAMAG